jgi:hypothetical protein
VVTPHIILPLSSPFDRKGLTTLLSSSYSKERKYYFVDLLYQQMTTECKGSDIPPFRGKKVVAGSLMFLLPLKVTREKEESRS